MKRFILASLLVLCTTFTYAQFNQGTLYTAGFGAFSRQSYDQSNTSGSQRNVLGNVAIGFFPANKFMIGVASGLISDKTKSRMEDNDEIYKLETLSNSFTIGPVARYYFFKGFHCEAAYLIGKTKVKQDMKSFEIVNGDVVTGLSMEQKVETKLRGFSAGVGYSIFLDRAKHLALDLGISYQRQKIKETEVELSGIAFGFGISGFIFRGEN